MGFRLYELLRSAVLKLIDERRLFILRGDDSIRNATVLATSENELRPPVTDLGSAASEWATGIVSDFVSTGPGCRQRVVEALVGHLGRLASQEIHCFTFKAAIDGLKKAVDQQIRALYRNEQGEVVIEPADGGDQLIRVLHPETWVDEMDSFRKLVACVSERVVSHKAREKTKEYLARLWGLLRWLAGGVEEVPSHRQIAEVLKIPRAQVPRLLNTLGGFARKCLKEAKHSPGEDHA